MKPKSKCKCGNIKPRRYYACGECWPKISKTLGPMGLRPKTIDGKLNNQQSLRAKLNVEFKTRLEKQVG